MSRNMKGKRYDLRPRRTRWRHWRTWRMLVQFAWNWGFTCVLSACTCTVLKYSRVCHLIWGPLYHGENLNGESKSCMKDLEWVVRMVAHGKVDFAQSQGEFCMRMPAWGWMGKLNGANGGLVWGWTVKLNGFCTSLNGDPAWGWARQLQTGSCLCVFVKMWEIHGLTFLELKQAVKRLRLQLSLIKEKN